MVTHGINTYLIVCEYLNNIPKNTIFFNSDIYKELKGKCGKALSKRNFDSYVYVYTKKLCPEQFVNFKECKGSHYKKGVDENVNYESLLQRVFLRKYCENESKTEVYGYPTKEYAYFLIGLKQEFYKPYSYKSLKRGKTNKVIHVQTTSTNINYSNYKYWFILDIINYLDKTEHCNKPGDIIYNYIEKNRLSWETLVYYSRNYRSFVWYELMRIAKDKGEIIKNGN